MSVRPYIDTLLQCLMFILTSAKLQNIEMKDRNLLTNNSTTEVYCIHWQLSTEVYWIHWIKNTPYLVITRKELIIMRKDLVMMRS